MLSIHSMYKIRAGGLARVHEISSAAAKRISSVSLRKGITGTPGMAFLKNQNGYQMPDIPKSILRVVLPFHVGSCF